MNRVRVLKHTFVVALVAMACGGCITGKAGGSAADDSTTREAKSLLASIFKVDGKLFGAAKIKDLEPLLNAAGTAFGVPGVGSGAAVWDDKMLAALGRKVDEASAAGVDPFAAVPSVDGPWTDAEGAPVKFPLKRERVKRLIETFGGAAVPAVPSVPVPPPVTPSTPTNTVPEKPTKPGVPDVPPEFGG